MLGCKEIILLALYGYVLFNVLKPTQKMEMILLTVVVFFLLTNIDGKRYIIPTWQRVLPETRLEDINWIKPKLGLVDFGGSRQNNIVDVDLGLAYAFSCFIDPHETDPRQKYKCCWGHPGKIRACLGYSADGIRSYHQPWSHHQRSEIQSAFPSGEWKYPLHRNS